MPTFFSSTNSKRHGPQHSKDNANAIALVKNPVKSDPWTTFLTKIVAEAPITSADITITENGDDLLVTVNGKSDIDQITTALETDDICMTILDKVSEEVKYCIDANDKAITNDPGDRIDLPMIQFSIRELKKTVV